MPYKIVKDTSACSTSKPWAVKKVSDDKLIGCHPTREKAAKQIAAIEANESKHNQTVLDKLKAALHGR